MTPEDRQLISGLFDRMREVGSPEKDGEAEALIRQSVQQNPDAPYMLVQSVLVQEHALQQADARIRELEQKLQEAQSQPAPAAGGFLGGLFGASNTAPRPQMNRGSVPPAGNRGPIGSGPIGAPARATAGRPLPASAQAGGGGGSFLQSAMATAAGVAGGMLLANGISSLLGGSSAEAGQTHADTQQPEQASHDDTAGDDANLQDASHDDSGDWGDWGGGDMDLDI